MTGCEPRPGATCQPGPCMALIITIILAGLSRVITGGRGTLASWHSPEVAMRGLLQDDNSSSSLMVEQCINEHLRTDLRIECSAGDSSIRDSVVHILRTCLPSTLLSNEQVVRLLMWGDSATQLVEANTRAYQALTGTTIQIQVSPSLQAFTQAVGASMMNAANESFTHEAWRTITSFVGDGLALGVYKDLSQCLYLDKRLDVADILPAVKNAITHDSQVFGLPLGGGFMLLYYNKALFAQQGWQVPRTWHDLVSLVSYINTWQGGQMDGFEWPCELEDAFTLSATLVRDLMATHLQTKTAMQGWELNAETGDTLLTEELMVEVVSTFQALHQAATRGTGWCTGRTLAAGTAAMTLGFTYMYKAVAHASRHNLTNIQGSLGVAPLPGVDRVMDRATMSLQPCTPTSCPYATQYQGPNGTSYLVNYSPGFEVDMFAINSKASDAQQFFALSTLSYLASPNISNQFVFDVLSEAGPSRYSHLRADAWVAAGYHPADTQEFVSATRDAFFHPNLHQPEAVAGSTQLSAWTYMIAVNATIMRMSTSLVTTMALRDLRALLNSYPAQNRIASYRAALGWTAAPVSNTSTPAAAAQQPPAPGHAGSNSTTILLAVLCSIVPILLGTLLGLWFYRRRSAATRDHLVDAPGVSPLTTLLVTDIENSTLLWESLAPSVMDVAIKLHNQTIRSLAAQHRGYESVWEGDSFVICFPTPLAALQFCMDTQLKMLGLNYPAELLCCEHCPTVWLQPSQAAAQGFNSAGPAQAATAVPLSTSGSLAGLPKSTSNPEPSLAGLPCIKSTDAHITGTQAWSHGPGRTGSSMQFSQASCETRLISAGQVHDSSACSTSMNLLAEAAETMHVKTLGQEYKAAWTPAVPGATGAVLAYRGLRVRLGMHAGVSSAADITYNSVMRRHHYTGPIRVLSNAIASAGHGGQTMMSTCTAAAGLGLDTKGVLHDLPEGCHVFSMGRHQLNKGADGTADLDLLCMLPASLAAPRMAVQQEALRSRTCLLPGVLAAPVSWPAARPLYLACFQLPGMARPLTGEQQGWLSFAHKAVLSASQRFGGIISDDGWEVACLLSSRGAPSGSPVHGVVLVFREARDALSMVMDVHSSLARLARPELQPLDHSVHGQQSKEQAKDGVRSGQLSLSASLGQGNTMATGIGSWYQLDMRAGVLSPGRVADLAAAPAAAGAAWLDRQPSISSRSSKDLEKASMHGSEAPSSQVSERAADLLASCASAGTSDSGADDWRSITTPADSPRAPLGILLASCHLPPNPATTTTPASPRSPRNERPAACLRHNHGGLKRNKSESVFMALMKRGNEQAVGPAAHQVVMVHEQGFSCGVALRACVVASSAMQASVSTFSTGRVLYSGKGPRHMMKLIKTVPAGAIVTTMDVLQAATPGSAPQCAYLSE